MDVRTLPEEYGIKPIFDFQEYLTPIREQYLKKDSFKNETRLPTLSGPPIKAQYGNL